MIIHYSNRTKGAAQELRKHMTPQETKLWYGFLRRYPVQFRRQKQFERFIVDFYCAAAKLIIEIDGSQHFTEQGKAYDQERTYILGSYGLEVIRFTNQQIDDEFDFVCRKISDYVHMKLTKSE